MKLYEVTIEEHLDGRPGYTRERWYQAGELHRDEGPAIITRNSAGVVVAEQWYKHGKLHRHGAPAVIQNDNGWYRELWCENDIETRIDGPSCIEKHEGRLRLERWSNGYGFHREDGPALVNYKLETGVAVDERWYQHAKLHRIGGPARIQRDPTNGEVLSAWDYLNGRRVSAKPNLIANCSP